MTKKDYVAIAKVIKDNKLRESLKLLSVKKSIELLKQKDYDLIHNHYSWRFFLYVGKHLYNKTPIVTTHHGALRGRVVAQPLQEQF